MKKLLSVLLATLMVISVFPAVMPHKVVAVDTVAENTAYLAPTSGDDGAAAVTLAGSADHKPFSTFAGAYNALGAAGGGKLIIEETFAFSAGISTLKAHTGTIVITGASDDVAIEYNGSEARQWIKFAGPVVIENITFKTSLTFYLLANHNPFTIGEGVVCDYGSVAVGTAGIVISGGTFNTPTVQSNTDVTVKSGTWRCVVGGGVVNNASAVVTEYEKDENGDPTNVVSDKYSKSQNGTYKTTIEGGTITTLVGGHWSDNGNIQLGGQSYVYVKGGQISKLYFGSNNREQATVHDGIVVYTGGYIGQVLSCRTTGVCTLLYGNNVSRNETNYPDPAFTLPSGATSATQNVLVANVNGVNKNVACYNINLLHVIPLATEDNATVYLKYSSEANINKGGAALGTEENPVRYMHQAIAMLTYTGGTVKLLNDYTFAVRELNGMCQFVEPDHAPIAIDGQGFSIDGAAGVQIHTEFSTETTGMKTDVSYGYNTYLMNGDTTFKNVDVTPTHEVNFAANFNHLVFGDDVVTTGMAWISGAVFFSKNYNSGTYVNNHYDSYQYYSDADTNITINSGTNIKISGYSRLATQNSVNSNPFSIHYPGTANITVNGGVVDTIYSAPTNSKAAYGSDANIVINGGTVRNLFVGGHAVNYGIMTGDVTVTINGGTVTDFKTAIYPACEGDITYVVNKSFADYLAIEAALKDTVAIVDTEIADPQFANAGYSVKDCVNGTVGVRAKFAISPEYFVGENADDYNIVELGVLVATSANEGNIKYVKGNYYYGVTDFSVEAVNHENYIAKSVMYVKEADAESESYDAYMWAGADADDTNVYFTAPVVGLEEADRDIEFVFCPYIVVVDEAGNQQVFYGDVTEAVTYNGLIAE